MRTKWALFFVLFVFPIVAFCATLRALATYLDLPDGANSFLFAADSSGNFFVGSWLSPSELVSFRVDKIDAKGSLLASMDLPSGATLVAMAVDASGNLVIAGLASPAVPLVSPLQSQGEAFIMKMDPLLRKVLFSTRFGGTRSVGPNGGTVVNAVVIDGAGNIYVTGGTRDTDFPITQGAYQVQPPGGDQLGSSEFAYVTEISGDGQKLLFSTFYGSDHVVCVGGSDCIGVHGATVGTAIALDSDGNVVIGGNTDADQLPITPGVFGPNCGDCEYGLGTSFLAKFGSNGSMLLWATYFPAPTEALEPAMTSLQALAIDSTGNIIVGGSAPAGFPVTAHAVQPAFPDDNAPFLAGFVSKVDSTAQALLFSTYFGGGLFSWINGLTVDPSGTIWLTGFSLPDELPAPKGASILGTDYVAALSPDGSTETNIFTAPDGAAGEGLVQSNGAIMALGEDRSLLSVLPGSGPSLVGVENAAGTSVSAAVAPYEVISIYGIGIGPSTPAGAQVVNGFIEKSLGGVQVSFDGIPAPLLYVGATQINVIVPHEVAGKAATTIEIVTPSGVLPGPTMLVRATQPDVFPLTPVPAFLDGTGAPAAAVNQDGSPNSPTNPAEAGSVVSVWVTGAGTQGMIRPNGEITKSAGHNFEATVAEWLGSSLGPPVEVLYAGDAPGMVNGVAQLNFRLPMQPFIDNTYPAPSVSFQLQVGEGASGLFSIYVKQVKQ